MQKKKTLQMEKKMFDDQIATAKEEQRDLGPPPTNLSGKGYRPGHKGQGVLPTPKQSPLKLKPQELSLKPKAQAKPMPLKGKGKGQGHKNVVMKGAKGSSSSSKVQERSSSSNCMKEQPKTPPEEPYATAPWRGPRIGQVLFV